MNKNKLVIMIISVVLVAILVVGTTYALWPWWSSENTKTNVTFTTGTGFSCSADGGGNITQNDATLIPTSCTNSPYVIKRTITTRVVNSTSNPIYMDLKLKVNNISTELSNSQYFSYALTDSSTSCTSGNVFSLGSFNGTTTDSTVDLIINDLNTQTGNKTYYLYIWLDTAETNNNTQNQIFNLELTGECRTNSVETPNKPYLYGTGLIPVKLSDNGATVTTVSENDSTWYDYDNKKWANAVLVNENTHTRSYYKSNPYTIVPQSDILAYYVWIPRYSYQVWAYSGSDLAGNPHEISIKFIGTDTIDNAAQIGDWYTHPAFWWDDDSDGVREEGEELSGIWVGKFETSHTTLSSNTSNSLGCSQSNCTTYNGLRVLPNVSSLGNNNLSNFFYAARFMASNGNAFGLDPEVFDSHLIKNRDWAAVAYLSHSIYGINTEITSNGFRITGSGNAASNYGQVTSYPQSTTGNITGVFDMSGGLNEYVMANYNNSINTSGFSTMPESKYYDNYTITDVNSCTFSMCGGHALNETKSWYSDNLRFFISSANWLRRGGYYTWTKGYTGPFGAYYGAGNSDPENSSRLVLIRDNE